MNELKLIKFWTVLERKQVNISVINYIVITGVRLDVRSEIADKNNSHLNN